MQICRVEDLHVNGIMKGSIIHIQKARTVIIDAGGLVTAFELGFNKGVWKGNYSHGAGRGVGHGGRRGVGYYNGLVSNGGDEYGDAHLPCELGSGTEGPSPSYGRVFGGEMIVFYTRITQATSKAMLTQMISIVLRRMETDQVQVSTSIVLSDHTEAISVGDSGSKAEEGIWTVRVIKLVVGITQSKTWLLSLPDIVDALHNETKEKTS